MPINLSSPIPLTATASGRSGSVATESRGTRLKPPEHYPSSGSRSIPRQCPPNQVAGCSATLIHDVIAILRYPHFATYTHPSPCFAILRRNFHRLNAVGFSCPSATFSRHFNPTPLPRWFLISTCRAEFPSLSGGTFAATMWRIKSMKGIGTMSFGRSDGTQPKYSAGQVNIRSSLLAASPAPRDFQSQPNPTALPRWFLISTRRAEFPSLSGGTSAATMRWTRSMMGIGTMSSGRSDGTRPKYSARQVNSQSPFLPLHPRPATFRHTLFSVRLRLWQAPLWDARPSSRAPCVRLPFCRARRDRHPSSRRPSSPSPEVHRDT